MCQLNGKVVLITGSTHGIGEAALRACVEAGARVMIHGRDEVHARALHEELGDKTAYCVADLVDESTPELLVNATLKAFGRLDVLVNNAGIFPRNSVDSLSLDNYNLIMTVNLRAPMFLCQQAVKAFRLHGQGGSIINIGSIVGSSGNAGQANYTAAKAGLVGFSKSLAQEIASRNITVNVVSPGFISTDMTSALPDMIKEEMLKRIPMKRLGQPDDIAKAVVFLASDDASYITGATIHVNGGMMMD